MSATDDLISSKDKDDILNEDLVQSSNSSSNKLIVSDDNFAVKIFEGTTPVPPPQTNNETGEYVNLLHNDSGKSAEEPPSALESTKASGDCIPVIEDIAIKNNSDADDEENLELRWDEDDGNSINLDKEAESCDGPKNYDNKPKNDSTMMNVQKIVNESPSIGAQGVSEINIKLTENISKQITSDVEIKDAELEEDPEDTTKPSKIHVMATPEVYDEDELLKDDESQDSMDVDKNQATTELIDKLIETLNDDTQESKLSEGDDKLKSIDSLPMEDDKKEATTESIDNLIETLSSNSQEFSLTMEVDTAHSSITQYIENRSLNKPDVMIEIPSQELIDIDNVLDSPNESLLGEEENKELVKDSEPNNDSVNEDINKSVEKDIEASVEEDKRVENETETINKDIVGDIKSTENISEVINGKEEVLEKESSHIHTEPIATKAPTIAEPQPSTSTSITKMTPDSSNEVPEMTDSLGLLVESSGRVMDYVENPPIEPQPSTSTCFPKMTPDTSDEVPEMTDSLGLLAVSSGRVMDDDDDDDGDGDDDEDFDQDESSNQVTSEHSEDSNAQHSDNETARETEREELDIENTRDLEERVGVERNLEERDIEDNETESNQGDEDFVFDELDIEDNMKDESNGDCTTTDSVSKVNIEKGNEKIKELNILDSKSTEEKETASQTSKDDILKTKDKDIKEKNAIQSTKMIKEKDSIKSKSIKKKETAKKEDSIERPVVSPCSSSNDDVIEQLIEIDTVKVSDDEEEPKESESTKQTDKQTSLLDKSVENRSTEKIKQVEKEGKIEELNKSNDVPKTTEIQKTMEETSEKVLKSPKVLEKVSESDKVLESDSKIVDLTPGDQSEEIQAQSNITPKSSPKKLKTLSVSTVNANVLNIVELGESSSEDDVLEVEKESESTPNKNLVASEHPSVPTGSMTSVNIPTGIDIMSTSGTGSNTSQIPTKEGEVVISGVPKPPPQKLARLNTSEVTIKTASTSEQTLVIPEAKKKEKNKTSSPKTKLTLEIFSLDSDEEEPPTAAPQKPNKKAKKCINSGCTSDSTELLVADRATAAYYECGKKRRAAVCRPCADAVLARTYNLVESIKNFNPLLELEMSTKPQDLVEVLDSESEDEDLGGHQPKDIIGIKEAVFLENNLVDVLNETWLKYKLDDRLKDTENELNAEILKMEEDSKEIHDMLDECQRATDKLRHDLYTTFEPRIESLQTLIIYDAPEFNYIGPEVDATVPVVITNESRLASKRKMLSNPSEPQAKRPAIPLGYSPLDDSKSTIQDIKPEVEMKVEEDKDISVVKLSAESAPADLPPPGEANRPLLRVGAAVYAMRNAFGPWFKGRILEIMCRANTNGHPFTTCRVRFDHKTKTNSKVLPARCIAYDEPAAFRMTIGTRLIALFKNTNKRECYYSGVVAEIPNPVNSYRYLVFFDDGYAQYVNHAYTRLVCEHSSLVWEEVHPLSREFVKEYLTAYPERPMVRLHELQHLKTEWDGKWWSSRVEKVDASLAQVVFLGDGRREWIYRGSTRLAPLYLELRAAERHRPRRMPRSSQPRSNMMPYVEYTRSDEQKKALETLPTPVITIQENDDELRRQRAVARKSTTISHIPSIVSPRDGVPHDTPVGNLDTVTSRVVYYTPKNAVRPHRLTPHACSTTCRRSDVLSLADLRTYNPLAKPLLSGWERQIVRFKGQKEVMYRAPCGRRLRNMQELHRYLRLTDSELPVDLFDFHHATHCLSEFVLNKCFVGKKDLSHGKENVPVPCVNYYDEALPEFCSYNTERTPTSGVPLNLDPEFLCGCDCTDDCEDKSKCACWKMTLEGARTIGMDTSRVGYEYKRLPDPLPSGIYECNSRCKCKQTCLNRVAQHPLQLKLQVFKTLNRGWGIRALNDVPKGSFLCVYAGNLLTDATANLDGLNEGDEYLAELDYIEVVEQMKEGYEADIHNADKKLVKEGRQEDSEEEMTSSSEEEDTASKDDKDDDFRPGFIPMGVEDFNKRLRKRGRNKKELKVKQEKDTDGSKLAENNAGDVCITISDDDEVREPSTFTARPGMGGNDFVSKYSSVRTLFGEDEACYIMDAKVQGNIGRYLNHSCTPNVFVQNVFVDTHDPRFPWVAFFALSHIKAGTELTWNYNYDVGSVPGKILYCYCEAPNCRGRLL